jgi:hypothetical protein
MLFNILGEVKKHIFDIDFMYKSKYVLISKIFYYIFTLEIICFLQILYQFAPLCLNYIRLKKTPKIIYK